MTKARNIANIASDGSALADGTINYTDVSGTPTLATVATSGSFNDLSNQPAAFDPNTLAAVAVSGAYADVTGTPAAALPLTGGTVTGNVTLNGALNGVTSVDATTAASITAAGVGGGGTIDFVASGSVAAGKPVRLNANGTVSQIESGASFDVPDNIGLIDISALVASTDVMTSWVFDSANNKAAFVYLSATNIYLRAGYFNGTSWTWGAAVQLGQDKNNTCCAAVGVDSNGVFLVYYYHSWDSPEVSTENARAFTVNTSGTMTLGTNVVLRTNSSVYWGLSTNSVYWDNTNNLWLIQTSVYYSQSYVYHNKMYALTVSGTTITGVGGNQVQSTWTYAHRPIQVDEVNKYLYMAHNLGTAQIMRFSYSTSGVSAYTDATGISGANSTGINSSGMSKFQSVYLAVSGSNFMTYTPVWGGTATGITNVAYSGYNVADSICAWKNFATSTAHSQEPTRINLSTGATDINPISSALFGAKAYTQIWFDNYIDNQFYYIAYVNSTYYLATRFLSNNSAFIGVADETKTTGQTVKVTVFGGTNDKVSGLTPAIDYYASGSGNINTLAGQFIGKAVAATKILVKN